MKKTVTKIFKVLGIVLGVILLALTPERIWSD